MSDQEKDTFLSEEDTLEEALLEEALMKDHHETDQSANIEEEVLSEEEIDEKEEKEPEENESVMIEADEKTPADDGLSIPFQEESEYDGTIVPENNHEELKEDTDAHAAGILEGLLFLTGDEGISLEQAADTMGITEERAEYLFDLLQKFYLNEDRGIEIARFGGKYKFLSKAFVHEYAEKLFQISKKNSLSQAALETLAIIAYKQPVTRVEIEEIRGVGADVMLRKLQARNLIKEDGRSDAPGRPILYSVTDEFMDAFQLLSLDELPELPSFGDEDGDSGELFES